MYNIRQKIGKWTVIDNTPVYKQGRKYYMCICTCGIIDEVYSNSLESGKSVQCRNCARKTRKRTRTAYLEYEVYSKDYWKWSQRKFKYGITPLMYQEMLEKQNNCCAICKRHKDLFQRDFHIDHCHTTGSIRGLLCSRCNMSLGGFGDSIEILNRAIKYLKMNV